MIEEQVEEARQKISKELEATKLEMKRGDLRGKLGELKQEYLRKMKIIEEIKRDKKRQEDAERLLKEKVAQKRAEESKFLAQNFKDLRHIDKLRAQQ